MVQILCSLSVQYDSSEQFQSLYKKLWLAIGCQSVKHKMRKWKLKFVFQQSILRAFTHHRSLHTLIKAENIFEKSYQRVIFFFFLICTKNVESFYQVYFNNDRVETCWKWMIFVWFLLLHKTKALGIQFISFKRPLKRSDLAHIPICFL